MENIIYDLNKMNKKLKKYVDEGRFIHTQGVMHTSACLAMVHGEDILHAQAAGLLHDCAKCIPNDKKVKMCMKHGIEMTSSELENPFLLHAKLGAYVANKKYHIDDEDILSAIRYHTTGRAGMSLLEKIVFVADYIEPNRYKAKNLAEIRKMSFSDLDEAVYMILRDTLKYLRSNPNSIDMTTNSAYEYYKEIHETKVSNQEDNQ